MKVFAAKRIDADYSLTFDPPIFALMPKLGLLLARVYSALHLRYTLSPYDLRGLPTESVGTVGARIELFNGAMSIEIKPAVFAVSAERISTSDDLQKVMDAADLSLKAYASMMSEDEISLVPSKATLNANLWLGGNPGFRDGAEVQATLNAWAPEPLRNMPGLKLSKFYPHFVFENEKENYSAAILIQESALDEGGLFVNVQLTALAGSHAIPLQAGASLVRAHVNQILAKWNARLLEDGESL